MKRLHKSVRGICGIQLTFLLICVFSTTAFPSTDQVQTYVSRSGSKGAALDGPSSFLLARHQEDSIVANSEVSTKLKDPGKALLYALVPGFVVHGAGHFYAGEKTAGWVLAGGEILSVCLIAYAVGVSESGNGSTSDGNTEIIGVFGGLLFAGTWMYDVIGAPLAVQRENRDFLQGERPDLKLQVEPKKVELVIVCRFR
ncbi:MAG: hypothetical protein JSV10_06735 [Candidatus Zixiibacteriota bacterium]|nr:MAG: hypothetical protein JSV10_06735 [candidate division Zixibacteria bacterium]